MEQVGAVWSSYSLYLLLTLPPTTTAQSELMVTLGAVQAIRIAVVVNETIRCLRTEEIMSLTHFSLALSVLALTGKKGRVSKTRNEVYHTRSLM